MKQRKKWLVLLKCCLVMQAEVSLAEQPHWLYAGAVEPAIVAIVATAVVELPENDCLLLLPGSAESAVAVVAEEVEEHEAV